MKADEQAIVERAAEWMAILEDGGSPEERAAFGRWLRESPRHIEETLALNALHRATEGFDPEREIPLAIARGAEVIALNGQADTGRITPRRWRWAAAAACIVAGTAVVGWSLWSGGLRGVRHYTTAVGEQRVFDLADGSVIHLNTDSKLEVSFSKNGREIRLLTGEALFRVAPDSRRPFRVTADRTVIQALGTQFNVYRQPDRTTAVAVLEGTVRVNAVDLGASEGVSIGADGRVGPRAAIDAGEVTAWRQRRLMFRKDRLADVVREFNRYSNAVQLAVADPGAADLRLSGVFDADDPKSLLLFLAEDATLEFEQSGRRTVIRSLRR